MQTVIWMDGKEKLSAVFPTIQFFTITCVSEITKRHQLQVSHSHETIMQTKLKANPQIWVNLTRIDQTTGAVCETKRTSDGTKLDRLLIHRLCYVAQHQSQGFCDVKLVPPLHPFFSHISVHFSTDWRSLVFAHIVLLAFS